MTINFITYIHPNYCVRVLCPPLHLIQDNHLSFRSCSLEMQTWGGAFSRLGMHVDLRHVPNILLGLSDSLLTSPAECFRNLHEEFTDNYHHAWPYGRAPPLYHSIHLRYKGVQWACSVAWLYRVHQALFCSCPVAYAPVQDDDWSDPFPPTQYTWIIIKDNPPALNYYIYIKME